jgi:hypothetical protein
MGAAAAKEGAQEGGRRGAGGSFWSELTPREAGFVRKSRAVEVLFKAAMVVMFPYWNQSYLDIFKGDSGAMAVHYGVTRVVQNVIHLVVYPLTSTLSDTLGRKHLMTWGRLGTVAFFVFHRFRDRSPLHRLVMENVCWPLSNASWPVFAAAHSDLFGDRPALSARIQAADGLWVNVVGIGGGALASLVSYCGSPSAGQEIGAVLTALTIAICQAMPETLPAAERKPFVLGGFLRRVNPLANATLLFTKGPGLRRLATSTLLWFVCNQVWATQTAFRMGVLGWSPLAMSYFASGYDGVGVASQALFVNRLAARVGNRTSMELGAAVSVASYALQGLCMLPSGARGVQSSVQYMLAIGLLQTLPVSMRYASRAMVVKQGIAVCGGEVGRGELNGAYAGLGTITGIFSALLWGALYQFFLKGAESGKGPRWLRWGKGGHFFVAAGVMALVFAAMRGADPATLFLEEEEAAVEAPGPGPEAEAE